MGVKYKIVFSVADWRRVSLSVFDKASRATATVLGSSKKMSPERLERPTFGSGVRCATNCAKGSHIISGQLWRNLFSGEMFQLSTRP